MENWLKFISTKVRGSAVGCAWLARLRSLTGALLPRLGLTSAVICLVTLSAFNAGAQYTARNLVSSTRVYSPLTLDKNLIDSWGLAALPESPWWLSAQNTSTSPLINANGSIVSALPLVYIPCVTSNSGTITVPCPFPGEGYIDQPGNPSNPKGNTGIGFGFFGPTGIVANTFANAFIVRGAPALFIWATQDGLIVAWNQSVSPITEGVVVANRFTAPPSTLYQGLAIAGPSNNPHLYAANLAGGIDVFDKSFALVNTFVPEPDLGRTNPAFEPAGPYGIQTIGDKLYLTYISINPKVVLGGGILDVCDLQTSTTNPTCHRLFASGLIGNKNNSYFAPILGTPWGIALAPHDFGPLCDKLLVGNVANGLINAFDPLTGRYGGTLNLTDGSRFSSPGLWGLAFGLGNSANGPTNNLFFSSGPSPVSILDSVQVYGAGLFGVIKPAR
ncbi:MAG: TIGR03118 family protein [Deltaproteobacteria bacterium]|nr:TIGR03118 family protein [Deltaproteobacteria bacterium]